MNDMKTNYFDNFDVDLYSAELSFDGHMSIHARIITHLYNYVLHFANGTTHPLKTTKCRFEHTWS